MALFSVWYGKVVPLRGRLVAFGALLLCACDAPAPKRNVFPHQPANLARFAEIDFSENPGISGTPGVLAGNWWAFQDAPTHLTEQSDSTAPKSPPSVLQVDFEAGTQPGYDDADQSVRAFGGWTTADDTDNTEYGEFYESTWFKIPTPDFETQEVGVKLLGYWGVGMNNTNTIASQLYCIMRGSGAGTTVMSAWNLDMYQQDVVSSYLPQNLNLSTKITAGTWHQFETYMKLNDIGEPDGIWEWWLDGVLIGSYTNVVFRTPEYPSGFWGRRMDAVWGGAGGTPKTRTDYLWIDHMYLAGAPLTTTH